jgi:hypothetical protein
VQRYSTEYRIHNREHPDHATVEPTTTGSVTYYSLIPTPAPVPELRTELGLLVLGLGGLLDYCSHIVRDMDWVRVQVGVSS